MGEMEEDEDFEAFEARQKAEQVMKNKSQADFDKQQGLLDGDGSGERRRGRRTADGDASDADEWYDSEYDSEGEDDLERAEDGGDLVDGFAGSSGEKGKSTMDLRKTRVRHEDYQKKRAQSAKVHKKGKYGVTVPRPFTMCKNEGVKPKSIRQRKIDEMIAQKQIEEEAIVKHQFRHKPIPPEVLIPRY